MYLGCQTGKCSNYSGCQKKENGLCLALSVRQKVYRGRGTSSEKEAKAPGAYAVPWKVRLPCKPSAYTTSFPRAVQRGVKVGSPAASATRLGHGSLVTLWASGIRGPPHTGLPQLSRDLMWHSIGLQPPAKALPNQGREYSAWTCGH